MKKYCVVNCENKIITEVLSKYGYVCISTEKSDRVSAPISLHADVMYLKANNDKIFISSCQSKSINLIEQLGYSVETVNLSPGYKTESLLNIIITEDSIICNPKTCIDISQIDTDKEIIKVNQGYTKCSTIALNKNYFITEDEGIYAALSKYGKNCLLINKGFVKLDGYDYGFIGGASAYLKENNTLLFFGDISRHPAFEKIKAFCSKINVKTDYICNMDLTDIGGIVVI